MSFESPMLDDGKEQTEGRYIAAAQVGAWLSMGIVNIVVTWLALPMTGMDVRLMLHLYDVGGIANSKAPSAPRATRHNI